MSSEALAAQKHDEDDDFKTTICHVPPGNPEQAHDITIGNAAVAAHLRNHPGDHLGGCDTCLAEGANCHDPTVECCPGFACQHGMHNPICVPCRGEGEACNLAAPCCAGLTCTDDGACEQF